jgi:radical SAM superfamily enzyme YgiQ (UPF0313 family)
MSRVLLVRPPAIFGNLSYSVPLAMPVSIAYLASSLLRAGHDVEALDAIGEDIDHVGSVAGTRLSFRGMPVERMVDRVAERPDCIGISAMFAHEWPFLQGLIGALARKFPRVPIVVGGEHATSVPEHVLATSPEVTAVVCGEGEATLVDFVAGLDRGDGVDGIRGLAWSRAGTFHRNPPRERLDPDSIPWPAWHLFDLEPYFRTGDGYGVDRGRSMPVVASRGCPYRCTFCSAPQMWPGAYRARKPSAVVDEIEHDLASHRADDIHFMDLSAVLKRSWVLEFCAEIERRGLRFTWQIPTGTRSEALTPDVLRAMARTGCRNIAYSPESGSERTLRAVRKKVSMPALVRSMIAAKDCGMFVKGNFVIGFPREERADILRTVALVLRLAWAGVDDAGVYVFSPYPGSQAHRELVSSGVLRVDSSFLHEDCETMDLGARKSYCEAVGPSELAALRLSTMALFYGISFGRRPWRIARLARNWLSGRSDTVFEQRALGTLKRLGRVGLRGILRSAGAVL